MSAGERSVNKVGRLFCRQKGAAFKLRWCFVSVGGFDGECLLYGEVGIIPDSYNNLLKIVNIII